MKKTAIALTVCLLAILCVGFIAVKKVKNGRPTIEENTETGTIAESVFTTESIQSFKIDESGNTEATIIATTEEQSTTGVSEIAETVTRIISQITEIVSDSKQTTESFKVNPTTTKPDTQPSKADNSSTYPYAYAGFNPKLADMSVPVEKILVNRDYILPENYTPSLAPSVTSIPDSKKLDSRVAPHYNEMYLAAKKDGITLTPLSGYRSYSLQKNNYENKIQTYINKGYSKEKAAQEAATIILPPGTSEHNAGLAMDICSLEQSFENSKEFKWLNEHAADYGFILRYPKNKENVTKIIYEPWHWRYVGVTTAKAIKASGLTLEEYLGKA